MYIIYSKHGDGAYVHVRMCICMCNSEYVCLNVYIYIYMHIRTYNVHINYLQIDLYITQLVQHVRGLSSPSQTVCAK